jgi:hypothetical protein
MPAPHAHDAALIPLPTDLAIHERVRQLIDRAFRRQIWFMFLDEHDRQIPLVMPCDIPRLPRDGDAERIGGFITEVMERVGAWAIVVTLERRGPAEVGKNDLIWLQTLRDACAWARVPLRGPLLAHRTGVRWIGPDDLAAP